LISGAGIAGLNVAYWLRRYGDRDGKVINETTGAAYSLIVIVGPQVLAIAQHTDVPLNYRSNIMAYVDGFVAAVPTANREIYKKHAQAAAVVFKEHGAMKLVECWGDDVPDGKITSFPMAVKRKEDETVVFSWIIWPSRKLRDEGIKKVIADPRLQPDTNPMPFDGKRMIYGGFEMIVEA
jgi:uncharacterized protein YbaA (DUF1428 family)